MRKVMFFIPTLGPGGGERVVSEVSQHLPESFESVIVLFENKVAYPYKGRIVSLDIPNSTNFFLRIFRWIPRFFQFKKVLEQEQPDAIVTFGGGAALLAILLGRKPIVRVDTYPSSAKKGFWGFVYRMVAKLFFRKAKAVIAVSKAAKEDLAKNFGVPGNIIQVLYNPIDVERIQQLSQEPLGKDYGELFSAPVMITMSRLVKGKGLEYLIDSFALFHKESPDPNLVLLGQGPLEATLRNRVKEYGLERKVFFLGWQENPYKFLARAKVFVLPSFWEGFPMSVVEALACGVPVISSDCKSGPREILAPSTDFRNSAVDVEIAEFGILFPPGDADDLKRALETNFKSDSLMRARDFSIEKSIPQWEKLLS